MADRIDAGRLETLLEDLVGIYSPSGKEQEICEYLLRHFQALGIPVECQPVTEDRYNLLIRPRGVEPGLLLMGHVDTVTASTPDQCQPRRENGKLIALGAADMKGGCAALVEAYAEAYLRRDGALDAVLALVVGEEENGDGTRRLLEHPCPPTAIVAEPTDLAVCGDHFGYLEVQLETVGVKRHAAEASREHNAVYSMLQALGRLTADFEARPDEVIFNIRDLQSSTAGFAVPDRCAAWLDLHVPASVDPGTLAGRVRELVSAADAALPGTLVSPRFPTCHRGYRLEESDPLPVALRDAFAATGRPWRTGTFRSHSDANLLWEARVRPVVLGPGRLSYAHTTTERVDVRQVAQAAALYAEMLERPLMR